MHPAWPNVRRWAQERIAARQKELELESNSLEKVPAHRREIAVLRSLLDLEKPETDE